MGHALIMKVVIQMPILVVVHHATQMNITTHLAQPVVHYVQHKITLGHHGYGIMILTPSQQAYHIITKITLAPVLFLMPILCITVNHLVHGNAKADILTMRDTQSVFTVQPQPADLCPIMPVLTYHPSAPVILAVQTDI